MLWKLESSIRSEKKCCVKPTHVEKELNPKHQLGKIAMGRIEPLMSLYFQHHFLITAHRKQRKRGKWNQPSPSPNRIQLPPTIPKFSRSYSSMLGNLRPPEVGTNQATAGDLPHGEIAIDCTAIIGCIYVVGFFSSPPRVFQSSGW